MHGWSSQLIAVLFPLFHKNMYVCIIPRTHPADYAPVCSRVCCFQTSLYLLFVWLACVCVCVCVRPTHATEWVSDLWIMQSAHRRGQRELCCGVLMREGLVGGRRDGLQSRLRMTAPTAGSQTINTTCVESVWHPDSHSFAISLRTTSTTTRTFLLFLVQFSFNAAFCIMCLLRSCFPVCIDPLFLPQLSLLSSPHFPHHLQSLQLLNT